MKKGIIVVLAVLICGLTACVPDYKGPAPPKEKTPVVSSGVVLPNGMLPDGVYKMPKTPERYYAEPAYEFVPSGEYGHIWPYIGGYDGEAYGSRDIIGICDEAGKIICDPVFDDAAIIEKDGRQLYVFIKTVWQKAGIKDDWDQYEELSTTTLATLDGSRSDKYERLLWEEESSVEYSTASREDGQSHSYQWRGLVKYDYITAEQGGKWGVLDWDGTVLLPFKYLEPVCFYEGLASVLSEDGQSYSFIDVKGKTVFGPFEAPPRAENTWMEHMGDLIPVTDKIMFYDGYAKYYEGGKYGIIDRSGREVVPAAYDFITCMKDGIAMAANGMETDAVTESFCILNDTGAVVFGPQEYEYWNCPANIGGYAVLPGPDDAREKVAYNGARTPYEESAPYSYDGDGYLFTKSGMKYPYEKYDVYNLNDDLLIILDREAHRWRIYDYNLDPVSPENPGQGITFPYYNKKLEYFFADEWTAGWGWRYSSQIYGLDGRLLLDGAYEKIIPIGERFMVRGGATAGLADKDGSYIIEVSVAAYRAD